MVRNCGAPVGGGNPSAGVDVPEGGHRIAVLHLGLTVATLTLFATGLDLAGGTSTIISCAAILLLGLPHGALDLVALTTARSPARALAIYLALGGAMAGFWWAMPGGALLIFFAIAIGHFGEDWPGPGLVAHGGALALLAAPLLFHRTEVDAMFAVIAGSGALPPLADSLVLVAPVAIAAALTASAISWTTGQRTLAVSSAAALVGMVVLPPIVGFALSFGMFHSPRQFARGLADLEGRRWRAPVVAACTAALLLAVVIALGGAATTLSDGAVRGTFIILSVLTVPHMMLPLTLRNLHFKHGAKLQSHQTRELKHRNRYRA
jgi:Brp/Blh family beta-carotene 15,15'-monooxygenase